MSGTLFIVGTPIGNLGDISRRALDTLAAVKVVAAEDTRHVRKLLNRFGIQVRTVSFREENRERAAGELIELLREGDVALVTDAGMPCISDPGAFLVAGARSAGFSVKVVPGPSACVSAVALSGFSSGGFVFAGFPPRDRFACMEFMSKAAGAGLPIVIYESPSRVKDTLEAIRDALGDVDLSVSRELTKIHEETVAGSVSNLLGSFPAEPKGEFVLVVFPSTGPGAGPDMEAVRSEISRALSEGRGMKETSKMVAAVYGISAKEAYSLALDMKKAYEKEKGDQAR